MVGPCQLGIGQCKCEALNREEVEPCRTICFFPPRTMSTKRSCWGDEACRRRTTTINSTAGTPRPKMSFQYAFPSEAPMSPSVSQVPTSGVTPSTGSKCSGMPCWGLGSKATCTLPVKPERGWEVVLTRNFEEMVYLTVLSSDTEGFKFLFPLSQAQEPKDGFFSPQPFGNWLLLVWSSDTVWLLSKNGQTPNLSFGKNACPNHLQGRHSSLTKRTL